MKEKTGGLSRPDRIRIDPGSALPGGCRGTGKTDSPWIVFSRGRFS
ncbi:MAG: hypothetical protein AABY92_04970 [Thermodesulfobacteriota bacterium]